MNIPSKYDASQVESKWYDYWMKNNYFHSTPDDREPYTIVIPPPNVTGVLHMGHMLNNTIQDVLIRRARLQGKNACWVPGTDHASIATEAKVVAKLKEQGIDKNDLSRKEFLNHAWDWTHEYGGVILEQLKKLGCSCDWDRTKFTMDDDMSEAVIKTFVDLYNKGLIYRGYRMVNWDPEAKTTLSDEEVIYEERQGLLYYLQYNIQDSDADGFTLNGSDIFGTLEIQMINNDTHDGDKHLIITLDGATDNVSLGIGGKEFNQYFVSIIDDEHPLAFILGGYSVEADSYYNGVYPWESSIIAVEGSSDEVDLVGFWGEPDAENMLRAKVNTETGIITIYTGQVLFNSATYGDAYIVKVAINSAGNGLDFFPDENIVGERISDDGVITFTDYGVHVNAGFFDGFKTVVWTKK